MGDPAGVGPETIVRAWADPLVQQVCRPLVIGYPTILSRAVELVRSPAKVVRIADVAEAVADPMLIPCLPCGDTSAEADAITIEPAIIDSRAGQAAYDALIAAVDLALGGRVDGIVTAPLHKAALWRAGHHYPGHTELLAERCGVPDFAMMLYLGPGDAVRAPAGLGVVHVTLHMALRDVFAHLSTPAILSKINLADTVASHLGLKISDKQELLELDSTSERLERVFNHMESEIGVLQVEKKIRNREWNIDMLMKTDTLQDSLEKYRQKIAGSARNRAAAYELALASGRNYRPGDQISYYITGAGKKVAAYESAKLASNFDPQNRDENIDYYVAKLDDLAKKFGSTTPAATQEQLL